MDRVMIIDTTIKVEKKGLSTLESSENDFDFGKEIFTNIWPYF